MHPNNQEVYYPALKGWTCVVFALQLQILQLRIGSDLHPPAGYMQAMFRTSSRSADNQTLARHKLKPGEERAHKWNRAEKKHLII